MKKMFSILTAALLALCILCTAVAEPADVTGDWYLNAIVVSGASMSPSAFGMDVTLRLSADGTATFVYCMGTETSEETGVWTQDAQTISVTDNSGAVQKFELNDDTLVGVENIMVFGREKTAGTATIPGPQRLDVAIEDFAGHWISTQIEIMGMQMDASVTGISYEFWIDGDQVDVLLTASTQQASSSTKAVVEDNLLHVPMADGMAPVALALHENDVLSFQISSAEATITLYLERAVEDGE